MKYNKNIKERINIDNKDFKEYSEKYSSIEIEIKIVENKYCKFINIKNEDEIYYHIYLNNKKKEIKMKDTKKGEKIKIIKIIIDYQVKSFEKLFDNCEYVESINFKRFYRNNIENMRGMFDECSRLKEIYLNNFNTTNVSNMSAMFSKCSSLEKLNLNNFNTNKVTNMEHMFSECSSLKELNLNNFNTNNVHTMYRMFSGCSNELIMKIKMQYKNIKGEAFR